MDNKFLANVTAADGTAQYSIENLEAGNYSVSADYNGDDNYLAGSANTVFEVAKISPALTAAADDITYGQTATVNVDLPDDATGNVEVTVNSKKYTLILANGHATLSIPNLGVGTYNVNINYEGNDKYLQATATTTVKVSKANTTTTLSTDKTSYEYGQTATLTANTPNATGTVSIYVNNEFKANVTLTNGAATYKLTGLDAGTYNVRADYLGNANYLASSADAAFSVNRIDSTVAINDITFSVGGSGSTTVNLTGATLDVSNISVTGHPEAVITYDGKITVSGLAAGEYTLSATTTPDANHNAATATSKVSVNKLNAGLSVEASDIEYGESEIIAVRLADDATGSIGLTINDAQYNLAIADGNAVFNISGLNAASYIAGIYYPGDNKYSAQNATAGFTVSEKQQKTFGDLAGLISAADEGSVLALGDNYTFDGSTSKDGIVIQKAITIDGNGHTLDGVGQSRIFDIRASDVTLNNIIFKNGHSGSTGGALQVTGSEVHVNNCSFIDCSAECGGSIYWNGSEGTVSGSTFTNSEAKVGSAIYSANDVEVTDSKIEGRKTSSAIYGGTVKNVQSTARKS